MRNSAIQPARLFLTSGKAEARIKVVREDICEVDTGSGIRLHR